MTIGMFQKYASKLYSLYEFGVYVDLNRNDEFFIERVADRISDDIINKIYDNEYDYLESEDIGSEGIDYVDIEKCSLIGINKVYSNISNGEVCIIYELEYEIELYCDSYEYWGRDDDTKEIIKSPAIKHTFKGSVVVSIERIIQELQIAPEKGVGAPELLKGKEGQVWSRTLNKKDRIVYEVIEDEKMVIISQFLGHYEDK